MKKRIIRISVAVAIGLGLLAGGVWVLSQALGDKEVRYQGNTSFYWGQKLKSKNADDTKEAAQVLNQEIIPGLTKTMLGDTNDSRLRMALVETLNELPGIEIIALPAATRRVGAAERLGLFGPPAAAAIPALFQALQGHDPVVRGPAAISLSKLRAKPDETIPLLINYLEEENLREDAAKALGEYGELASAALPKLQVLFKVPDKDLHHAVGEALRQIDPAALPQPRPADTNGTPVAPKTADSAAKGAGQNPAAAAGPDAKAP